MSLKNVPSKRSHKNVLSNVLFHFSTFELITLKDFLFFHIIVTTLGQYGMFLECFGIFWDVLVCFGLFLGHIGMFVKGVCGGFGMYWEVFGTF